MIESRYIVKIAICFTMIAVCLSNAGAQSQQVDAEQTKIVVKNSEPIVLERIKRLQNQKNPAATEELLSNLTSLEKILSEERLEQLRKHPDTKDIPVIMCTALCEAQDIAAASAYRIPAFGCQIFAGNLV